MFVEGRAISLGSIDSEADLKPIPDRINIHPPPLDGRCDCCGKHISELKPFGKEGDPLVGDFNGELLVKRFRGGPIDEETENALGEALGHLMFGGRRVSAPGEAIEHLINGGLRAIGDLENRLINKYGKEKGERYFKSYNNNPMSSWECRECIALADHEYWQKNK